MRSQSSSHPFQRIMGNVLVAKSYRFTQNGIACGFGRHFGSEEWVMVWTNIKYGVVLFSYEIASEDARIGISNCFY